MCYVFKEQFAQVFTVRQVKHSLLSYGTRGVKSLGILNRGNGINRKEPGRFGKTGKKKKSNFSRLGS
jgi:hypothetical protein